MKWTLQRISPEEDSVYLVNLDTGLVRQVSVPGAVAAWLSGELLMIRAKTGFLWEVEPDTGARRRIAGEPYGNLVNLDSAADVV